MSDPVSYTAVLPIGEPTVAFLSGLLAGERARRRTRRGRRALGCYRHAVLVLRWFLDGTRVAQLAADAVSFDLAPPLMHSGPELLDPDTVRSWFAGFEGPLGYDTTDLTVTVGGDVAFCSSLNRLSATPVGTTDHFELWFRSTTGLRKIDGRWLVTHEHTSTPFYMDGSFRAATDLEP